jgi:hypothetical protein
LVPMPIDQLSVIWQAWPMAVQLLWSAAVT